MEDRYLYRAKRTDNGEWIDGSLIQTPYLGSIRSWISSGQEDKARLREISSNQAVWRAFEVRTDTICQCTGLKDKNGNLIWENDIVRACWQDNEAQCEEIAQVAWDEFGYYPWLDEYHCDGCDLFNEVLDIEVIGNIFDNKELLESEEK